MEMSCLFGGVSRECVDNETEADMTKHRTKRSTVSPIGLTCPTLTNAEYVRLTTPERVGVLESCAQSWRYSLARIRKKLYPDPMIDIFHHDT